MTTKSLLQTTIQSLISTHVNLLREPQSRITRTSTCSQPSQTVTNDRRPLRCSLPGTAASHFPIIITLIRRMISHALSLQSFTRSIHSVDARTATRLQSSTRGHPRMQASSKTSRSSTRVRRGKSNRSVRISTQRSRLNRALLISSDLSHVTTLHHERRRPQRQR